MAAALKHAMALREILAQQLGAIATCLSLANSFGHGAPLEFFYPLHVRNQYLRDRSAKMREIRKNKSKEHGKNLSGSQHKDYSHTYNSRMQLSRLQRIYHSRNLTYAELENSLTKEPTGEIRRAYFFSRNLASNEKRCLVSMASDLEAFSR